jgi:urate oxidase / 2-oxo-4-hydroxy-4-carboxy-5-ureidoimidazoline decarboxylase
MRATIHYGKEEISFYRTLAQGGLLAARVTVDVHGDNFLPAYTEGDNTSVVATDTMKNFVYAAALEYPGQTQEGFAAFLLERFLATYPQMQMLRLFSRELPFTAYSDKLLSPRGDDYGTVELEAGRDGMRALRCGRRDMRLVKLTGSAFKSFVRDQYTTLSEVSDRPLYIFLDVHWRYADRAAAFDPGRVIPSENVAGLVRSVFDDFVSMSIQHLVHEMGQRLLARYPAMSEVSLEAQNRLWDTSGVSASDPRIRVYSDPKPAHGIIGLTLTRDG